MENYWVKELSSVKKINNTKNAWCYFFDQISRLDLNNVYESRNVILSNGNSHLGPDHWLTARNLDFFYYPSNLIQLRKIVSENIVLNSITKVKLSELRAEIGFTSEKTLGVFIRGSVYFNRENWSENFNPNLETFLGEVERTFNEKKLDNLFLVTEDYRINKIFRDRFNYLHIFKSLRFKDDLTEHEWLDNQKLTFDGGVRMGYEKNLIYLSEIFLLAECDFFHGTFSNASIFVLSLAKIWNGEHRVWLGDKSILVSNPELLD